MDQSYLIILILSLMILCLLPVVIWALASIVNALSGDIVLHHYQLRNRSIKNKAEEDTMSIVKDYSQLELKVLADLSTNHGISLKPLSYEEKVEVSKDTFELDRDKVRTLAVALQNTVIWRGCLAGGKFDEHYHTAEYHLYSDEWEMFHIKVTRKHDGKTILSAMTSETWSGTEYDYNTLWRAVANHDEIIEQRKRAQQ